MKTQRSAQARLSLANHLRNEPPPGHAVPVVPLLPRLRAIPLEPLTIA